MKIFRKKITPFGWVFFVSILLPALIHPFLSIVSLIIWGWVSFGIALNKS